MFRLSFRKVFALLLCLALTCIVVNAMAMNTITKNGKLYLADWDEDNSYTGERYEYDTWKKYYVMEDGEVPTGWYQDANGSWHFADSAGYTRTPWSTEYSHLDYIVIPAEVDSIDISELSCLGKNTVLYVTPGSYGEKFAQANAFPYDNGQKRVLGTSIKDENEKIKWIIENYIDPSMSIVEKIRILHDWITRNTKYDFTYSRYDSDDILIDQDGVCDAHAKAFEKLATAAGLDCRYTGGDTPGGGHAWNLVKVNGLWYHVDTTWDDPAADGLLEISGFEGYTYFILSDNEIHVDHDWTDTFIQHNNPYGFQLINGKVYYVDESTGSKTIGWKTIRDIDYSFDTEALVLIEESKLKRFHFASDGSMNTGWQDIDGYRYMFNRDGSMVRGEWSDENNLKYFFDRGGRLERNLFWVNNTLLRANDSGQLLEGIVKENGKTFYYSDEGIYGNNIDNVNNGQRYDSQRESFIQLDGENAIVTGIVENDKALHYYDEEGRLASSCWVQRDEGWSYIWWDGTPLTGGYHSLEKDGQSGYFIFDENGILTDCWNSDWSSNTSFSFPEATYHIHEKEIIPGQAATLTQSGLTRGVRCSICGEILSAQTVIPPFSQVACFVDRCYSNILNRNPDEAGLNDWTDNLESQYMTASTVINGFVNSNEFKNKQLTNAERVEIMYNTMLGRASDSAGKADWVAKLDAGMSINSIAAGFSGSVEFSEICNRYGIDNGVYPITEYRDKNYGVTGFVNRCYEEALDRGPDTDGLNYWCGQLLNGKQTAQQVAHGFISSEEMKNKDLTNQEFITTMYQLYLGREPDSEGLNYWIDKMSNGSDKETIESGFAQSNEFREIVAGYGIQ